MDSRNLLTVLVVIFVGVLLYNALYFTGVIGGFGEETTLAPSPQDERFDILGMNREGQVRQPRASQPPAAGTPAGQASTAATDGPRSTVSPAELTLGSNWGRNPFLTPREIWAVENFQPVCQTIPEAPPTDLYVSAVMLDSTGRTMAVINGEVYGVGDTIGGMQIVEMWNDAVVLQGARERHVVRIGDPAIELSSSPAGRQ